MKTWKKSTLMLMLLIGSVNLTFGQISVKILQKDIELEITKLDQLNSTYEEANLSITPSGKYIFFQSERPSGPDAKIYKASNGKLRYDANIWYSKKSGTNWNKPKCVGAPAGSPSNEDEPMVSPDGKTVAFQSWRNSWETSGGPYYVSQLYGETWGKPKGMGSGINKFFVDMSEIGGNGTDGAAISPDGKKFVFAWGKDYYGKLDLYMSTKGSNGTWSYPKKMKISTPGDERSVFFGSDSKTLFFSSDGYKGFGGLDIYKAVIDDKGNTKEVLNLGEKFNTKRNDFGFIITANGEEAYFVRDHDIYQATIKNPPVELLPTKTALVKGTVKSNLGKALKAQLKLVEIETGKVELTAFSNSVDGYYSLYINDARKEYRVELFIDGKKEEEAKIVVDEKSPYSEITLDFTYTEEIEEVAVVPEVIEEIPVPEKDSMIIVSDNAFERIHFSYKSSRLTMKALFKLSSTVKFLKTNTASTILVTGYTDPEKDFNFNTKISMNRAVAVAQFLRGEDIDDERIIAEYFTECYFIKKAVKHPVLNIRRVDISLIDVNDLALLDRNIINLNDLSGGGASTQRGAVAPASKKEKYINNNVINMDTLPDTETGGGFGLFSEYAINLKEVNDHLVENPDDAEMFFERGLLNYLMDDFNSALTDFDKAILLDEENNDAYYYRGVVHYETANYKDALTDFDKAIDLDPENALLYFYRGEVQHGLKNDVKACADWNTAETKSPGSANKRIKSFCNK